MSNAYNDIKKIHDFSDITVDKAETTLKDLLNKDVKEANWYVSSLIKYVFERDALQLNDYMDMLTNNLDFLDDVK